MNTGLAIGDQHMDDKEDYSTINLGNKGKQTVTQITATERKGVVSRFTIGAGVYFFLNKRWSLSSSVSVFSFEYKHLTNTTSKSQIPTSSSTASTEAKNTTNTFSASFNPFIQPLALTWGVSYFF